MSTRRIEPVHTRPGAQALRVFAPTPAAEGQIGVCRFASKFAVIASQCAHWRGNPPVREEMYRQLPNRVGVVAIFGGSRYLVPWGRGIATTSVRTGLAMTGNWATARQTPIRQPAKETRQAYSLVSGWTPVTEKMTHSAMLVAWSPMRSKYLATISRSRAYSPSPGFLAIKSRMSHLIWLK